MLGYQHERVDPQERKLESITKLVRRQLAACVDHEADLSRQFAEADSLTRLCLTGLAHDPIGLLYVPDIKAPNLSAGLSTNAGEVKVWQDLRSATEEAADAYGAAMNKYLPCLAIPDGVNRLVLVTFAEEAEQIEDMPLMRMRLGEKTYRVFMLSEYAKARVDHRVPRAF